MYKVRAIASSYKNIAELSGVLLTVSCLDVETAIGMACCRRSMVLLVPVSSSLCKATSSFETSLGLSSSVST